MLNNKYKSEVVNTLLLNKKEVVISNVPVTYKMILVQELCKLGCIQTLNIENEETSFIVVCVRYESDSATEKALEIDGSKSQGYTLNQSYYYMMTIMVKHPLC